jgi:hypothetical protein
VVFAVVFTVRFSQMADRTEDNGTKGNGTKGNGTKGSRTDEGTTSEEQAPQVLSHDEAEGEKKRRGRKGRRRNL